MTDFWTLIYLDRDSIYPIQSNLLAINSGDIKFTPLRMKLKWYLKCDLFYVR